MSKKVTIKPVGPHLVAKAVRDVRMVYSPYPAPDTIAVQVVNYSLDADVTRAFVSVSTEDDETRYTGLHHAMSDAELRQQVLASALRDMEAFARKYRELTELADLFRAIPKARKRVRESLAV